MTTKPIALFVSAPETTFYVIPPPPTPPGVGWKPKRAAPDRLNAKVGRPFMHNRECIPPPPPPLPPPPPPSTVNFLPPVLAGPGTHRLEDGIRAGDLGGYAEVLRQEHAADERVGGGEHSPQDRLRQRPLRAVPALVLPPFHLESRGERTR